MAREPEWAGEDRVMVVWCPDWPIVAARTEQELVPDAPIAVISRGEVSACSAANTPSAMPIRQSQTPVPTRCSAITAAASVSPP